eukprot:411513_1
MSQEKVWLYCDDGVDSKSIESTKFMLKNFLSNKYKIELIKAKNIIEWHEAQMKLVSLLIICDGNIDLYVSKLQGMGIMKLRKYLNLYDGNYLGIGSGAQICCINKKSYSSLNLYDGTYSLLNVNKKDKTWNVINTLNNTINKSLSGSIFGSNVVLTINIPNSSIENYKILNKLNLETKKKCKAIKTLRFDSH